MVFEFEVDGAFGSGEDDLDFMFCPGDFVDVGSVLLLVYDRRMNTFRMNWSKNICATS